MSAVRGCGPWAWLGWRNWAVVVRVRLRVLPGSSHDTHACDSRPFPDSAGSVSRETYPNTARWFAHVNSFTAAERAAWPLTEQQTAAGSGRESTLVQV